MAEAQDFQSLKDAITAAIRSDPAKAAIWTDLCPADMGIILLEMAAHVGDLVSYSADRRAQEAYLATAKLGESVRRIARSLGYPVQTRTPASSTVSCTTTTPPSVDVTLPEIQFASGGHQWLYPGGDVWAAGEATKDLVCSQAVKRTVQSIGTGLSWQTITLPSSIAVRSSIVVVVDSVLWDVVEIIGLAGVAAAQYEVSVADAGACVIRCGNDVAGGKFPSGATIDVSWYDSDGLLGAVGTDALAGQTISFWASELGTTMMFQTTASTAAIGASNEPTASDIRAVLLPWLRSCAVGVTAATIEALALAYSHPVYGRIAKVKASLNQANLIQNVVRLTVAASSGTSLAPVSDELKDALLEKLNESKIMTVEYDLTDPVFVTVDVAVRVHPAEGTQDRTALTAAVRQVFIDAFAPATLALGGAVYLSDLYKALDDLAKVAWAIITSHTDNIEPDATIGETLVLGTVEVTIV